MTLPEIDGRASVYVDGQPLDNASAGRRLPLTGGARPAARTLAIRVELAPGERALLGEVTAHVAPVELALAPWSEYALPWYSGAPLYRRTVEVPAGFSGDASRVVLDLGDVRHCAEIWVNGKLAKVCTWSPYQADVTALMHDGSNEIAVVVTNLLANRMFYRQFNSARAHRRTRQWHDGNIRRDAHALVSGLLTPPVLRQMQPSP